MLKVFECNAGGQLSLWQRRRNGCARCVNECYTIGVDGGITVAAMPAELVSAQQIAAQLMKGIPIPRLHKPFT